MEKNTTPNNPKPKMNADGSRDWAATAEWHRVELSRIEIPEIGSIENHPDTWTPGEWDRHNRANHHRAQISLADFLAADAGSGA